LDTTLQRLPQRPCGSHRAWRCASLRCSWSISVSSFLAYFGIEKWRPNPTITGITPVDLYYMPFTHSLLGSAVWALAAGVVGLLLAPAGRKAVAGSLVSALVFSHWLLDLVVHRPDLGILDNEPDKLGFGLWDRPLIEMSLEIGLMLVGFYVYLSSTRARGAWGRRMPWIVLALLLVLQSINWFGAAPQSSAVFSGLGLFAYALCVALAWLLDRTRITAADP
jgi:hypothetical protein